MTALCPGGGTSQPKAGHAAVVQYSSGLIASIFAAYDLAWLIPIIPLLSFSNQVLATFCAADPPTVSALTSAESSALLNLTFGSDFDSGLAKVRDLYLNVIWHDACECVSGTATPLTPPAPPSGTPIFQPPNPPVSTPCFGPTSEPRNLWTGNTFTTGGASIPVGLQPTAYVITLQNVLHTAPGWCCTIQVDFKDATGTNIESHSLSAGSGNHNSLTVAWPANGRSTLTTISNCGGSAGVNDILVTEAWYCGTTPGGTQQPCCPPDVSTQAYLDIIVRNLTLLQRQTAPFAYVYGANHAGLSGNGTLTVQGLLGCSVDVTTLPTSYGQESGSPVELFDLGFVTFGTADGWTESRRIDHDGTLVIPRAGGVFTSIGYTLRPGVVVGIRELVREP